MNGFCRLARLIVILNSFQDLSPSRCHFLHFLYFLLRGFFFCLFVPLPFLFLLLLLLLLLLQPSFLSCVLLFQLLQLFFEARVLCPSRFAGAGGVVTRARVALEHRRARSS